MRITRARDAVSAGDYVVPRQAAADVLADFAICVALLASDA